MTMPSLRPKVMLNLLAATEGGQVTRARQFLAHLREHDAQSEFLILKAAGTLPFCRPTASTEVLEVALPGVGLKRAAHRMLWENRYVPRLMSHGQYVYLTFSHYLPLTFPHDAVSAVGVSNLAPFSDEAMRAETSMVGKLKLRLLRRTILSSTSRASVVIALSNACRDALLRNGIPASKIHVIPNGVAPMPDASARTSRLFERLQLRNGYLLCVSHFHRYKNFTRLVRAYGSLPEQTRTSAPLVIVGKPLDRTCFEDVSALIKELGLSSCIRIIPGVDPEELPALYRAARLFVFPSLIENSPNILLEAMACGLPVLAGRIAPMPEFGADAARYFDPLDAADIAHAIETTLNDESALARMAERSLLRASEFSWSEFTRLVVKLYGEAAAHVQPRPEAS